MAAKKPPRQILRYGPVPVGKKDCRWIQENFPAIHPPHRPLPPWFRHSLWLSQADCVRLIERGRISRTLMLLAKAGLAELEHAKLEGLGRAPRRR